MKIKLDNVRLSFPALFEATQYKGQGAFNYSAKFLVPTGSDTHKAILAAIETVAREKWPKKYEAMLEEFRPDRKAYPYIDGKRVTYDGTDGMWVLSAKRKLEQGRPVVVDQDKNTLLPADGKPYSGCFVNASVEFWAQDGDTKGIRCTLRGVQFVRDGDSFSGASKPTEDEFDAVETSVEDLV